jgi:hypothetical protein
MALEEGRAGCVGERERDAMLGSRASEKAGVSLDSSKQRRRMRTRHD